MIIKNFVKNPLRNNNYVLIDEDSHEAVLIDCSEPADDIVEYVEKQGAKIKYILLTHAHFDHVMGVNHFKDKYGIDAFAHEAEDFQIENCVKIAEMAGFSDVKKPETAGVFDENDFYLIGSHKIKIIHTPGHTKGSVCFYVGEYLFSGDTLFYASYGRTDFPGGDESDMEKSLKLLFSTLPNDTAVYPGHGPSTTIAAEKKRYDMINY